MDTVHGTQVVCTPVCGAAQEQETERRGGWVGLAQLDHSPPSHRGGEGVGWSSIARPLSSMTHTHSHGHLNPRFTWGEVGLSSSAPEQDLDLVLQIWLCNLEFNV